jgi:hypothetical protein
MNLAGSLTVAWQWRPVMSEWILLVTLLQMEGPHRPRACARKRMGSYRYCVWAYKRRNTLAAQQPASGRQSVLLFDTWTHQVLPWLSDVPSYNFNSVFALQTWVLKWGVETSWS